MKGITILGATGSIGGSTLKVIEHNPDRYRIVALTANDRADRLYELCLAHRPEYAVMADVDAAEQLEQRVHNASLDIKVLAGEEGLQQVAELPQTDIVMAAIVGAAGLQSTLSAVRAGKRILLANKEALVMSGHLFMAEVKKHKAELLPIDSEHNAIFQCMPAGYESGLDRAGITRILLTASGGPFRTLPISDLEKVTPEAACNHPNWVMGRKISVDSATMMNKGLELIEACWLFNTTADRVQIVVHPQSVIHSMVEYVDGSVLAQLGQPDMRTPIAHALAWPQRMTSGVDSLDLFAIAQLDFEPPDLERFPSLRLAYEAANAGGTAPAILNAANEVAVQAFLDNKLQFTKIAQLIEFVLTQVTARAADSLDVILEEDVHARQVAEQWMQESSFNRGRQAKQ